MTKGFNPRPPRQPLKTVSAVAATALTEQLQSYLSEIEDPRVARTRAHLLIDILVMGILAVIAGAKGWEDIETYALSKREWLEQFLSRTYGIPCPDTFRRRVFERIDPQAFERCFQRWVKALVEQVGAQVIPIDGKTHIWLL